MLKVRLLQTPGIELNAVAVSLPFKRADALLYYMVVRRSASRQELIALLWESDDEAKGLKNLRNALYTLKKTLGGDVLVSQQKAMISLNPDWEIESDYDRFVHEGDLTAYGGPFLNGFGVKNAFALDEWIHRTREKLHGQYVRGLEARADAAREAGDLNGAIHWAELCLMEEPYDETVTVLLMKCLQQTRQFARATQVYQRLKDLLSREMGVDPLETTTLRYYEILNQWNDQARLPEDRTERSVPVGRERVYDALRAAVSLFLETPTRRSSQFLVGETGSGKSELIRYFLRAGVFASMITVCSESLRSERQEPLSAWNRLLRSLMEAARKEAVLLPDRAVELLKKTDDRAQEDGALLLCAAIAAQKKLLLILEDVQWADIRSVQLLSTVLTHLERGALMVIVTGTWNLPADTRQVLEQLETDGLLHRQTMMPISLADTAEFLRRELGSEASNALAERFYDETGGNLKLLADLTGAYGKGNDENSVLQTAGEMLLGRLEGLSEHAQAVAARISLFEKGVSTGLLLDLMDREDERVGTALRELRRRCVIESFSLGEIVCYRFVHKRLRELVYDHLNIQQRAQMHKQAAELLIRREPQTNEMACEEIAGHFRRAGEGRLALDYRLCALEQESLRRCAPFVPGFSADLSVRAPEALERDAADCLRAMAILRSTGELCEQPVDMELRLQLLRGRLALYRGDTELGMELMGPFSGASGSRNPVLLTGICILLADAAYYRQSVDLAERYVNTGMRLLDGAPDPVLQARLYRLKGCCFGLRGDYDRGGYYLHEAAELLEKQQPTAEVRCVLSAVYGDLGRSARCRNDFVHAGRWFKKAMAVMNGLDCAGQVWLYVHYGRTLFAVDDYMQARALFLEAYRIARERDELWGRTAAAAYCAYFQMTEGDYDLAARTLGEAMAAAEQMASPLESGILNFVCMKIRRRLDLEQREDSSLQRLLTDSADDYARRGVRLCSGIPDVFEMQMLSRDLRDGISTQLRYRSSELYSKNKRFMSE